MPRQAHEPGAASGRRGALPPQTAPPGDQFLRLFSVNRPLPPRAEQILAAQRRASEVAIGWVQLSVIGLAAALYAVSPQAWGSMTAFEPVPVVLAAYLVFILIRLGLAYRFDLPGMAVAAFIVIDFALLYGLIWTYHLQYGQPPGFYLKAPTLLYAFVFIALRGLRFEPFHVVFAGLVAATGWAALTLYAVFAAPETVVTRDFVTHITSNAVLIGAEVDRIVSILVATAVTTFVILRSRRHLVTAAVGRTATDDLSRFFSQGVVERILETDSLKAGVGEIRQAAILVTDIRGFTPLAASMSPDAVVRLLSDYQTRMGRIIREAGGSIDKFMGDGILASFGCLGDRPAPVADALAAAVALSEEAQNWRGEHAVRIGIAVASGPVVFGVVGDGTRLEYTVIGEPVNLAVKLEKHNKEAGASAITDRATFEAALAQGYEPPAAATARRGARVDGVQGPVDLVILR